ncbi:ribonucleases P/MRP protein subunit POP1 [Coccinella septempunctata]|uniref:ribonucleases P/MRP protein subunit POP1 n=1 Tax=Coccinella septempunctata TaxID=41139 RepID=UPI001D06105D|nr:ribonucleases P/MRP protein subunit POP1 [Coccinella septempunctata]
MDPTPDTFDGKVNLPSSISLSKFSYARCKEIQVMKKSLSSSDYSTKLAFQKLPRHMRRRAMSHNVKRLPRRLREKHMNQMKKSGLPPKQKRPSRKYRRKPSNLLEEYTRRQSKIKWLNTHIWYAKRFHMITKWGYKIPLCPCDKAFTACYRATKSYCLLQDISYFQCIEVSARREFLIENFKKITNPSDGLSIGSKVFANGLREGETTIYEFNSDRKKALGKIKFLWKYPLNDYNVVTSLWIWNHAAFHEDILQTLCKCFGLKKNESDRYCDSEKKVHLKELRTELCRFRLSGDLSNSVVQNCFTLCNSQKIVAEWFKNDECALKVIEEQQKYWKELKNVPSTNNLSPHIIVPVVACDPRLCAPSVRTKSQPIINFDTDADSLIPKSHMSPLWDDQLRTQINNSKISNSEVAKIRSKSLIRGSDLSEFGKPVPFIFIQRPGSRNENLGYSSGWDIILPSSWAQPVWISLIMWGARSGGLREYSHNNFEMGKFDLLFPDTPAGQKEETTVSEKCIETFFRKPPNRRTNFRKFNIVSPFKFNWKLLIENWLQTKIDTFIVLRDRKILMALQQSLLSGEDIALPDNCLVPVEVKCDKGVPKPFSIICIPNLKDLKDLPEEPICPDPNQKKRAEMRKQHKTLLKKLRNRRKKAKSLEQKLQNIDLPELIKYHTEMRKLWLPETENIRSSCCREVLGFIKEGGFSYTLGSSKGLGYVAGAALKVLLKQKVKSNVLIRNTNSRHYFLGKLSIVTDL